VQLKQRNGAGYRHGCLEQNFSHILGQNFNREIADDGYD
jgi:hypothetical protein